MEKSLAGSNPDERGELEIDPVGVGDKPKSLYSLILILAFSLDLNV